MLDNELYHYGVLGMKWGVRRYQNKDGSLTDAGKKHYGGDKNTSPSVKVTWKSSRAAKKESKLAEKKAAELKKKRQEAAKKAAETKKKNQEEAEKKQMTEAQKELLKKEIMSKGDYRKALDNIEMFSNSELKELVDRRNQINSLDAFKARERTKLNKGVEKTTEILNKVGNLTSAALKVYDNSVRISKIINGLDGDNSNKNDTKKEKSNDKTKTTKGATGIKAQKIVKKTSSTPVSETKPQQEKGEEFVKKIKPTFASYYSTFGLGY